jgi:cell shape-determining protein MreC
MMLLKFDATEINDAAAFLGPFCFSLFILLVVFICLSMFISIINDNFRHAREHLNDHQHIISFMLEKFQR